MKLKKFLNTTFGLKKTDDEMIDEITDEGEEVPKGKSNLSEPHIFNLISIINYVLLTIFMLCFVLIILPTFFLNIRTNPLIVNVFLTLMGYFSGALISQIKAR